MLHVIFTRNMVSLPRIPRRLLLLQACLVFTLVFTAHAELDIGRLAMGRTTYPAKSWAFDTFNVYAAEKRNDPAGDHMVSEFELERGETNRFGWELGVKTTDAGRGRLQLGRGNAGYLVV
jgi:hypothetical protein